MPHSVTSCHIHYIFSTAHREPQIVPTQRDRLWAYIGGIAREHRMKAVSIGGAADHVHALIMLPSTLSIAKAIQLLKGGSSKSVHDTFPAALAFAWQEGYGAFSVGISSLAKTVDYIRRQEEHHRTRTFQEEFLAFLGRYQVDYDPRYIWD